MCLSRVCEVLKPLPLTAWKVVEIDGDSYTNIFSGVCGTFHFKKRGVNYSVPKIITSTSAQQYTTGFHAFIYKKGADRLRNERPIWDHYIIKKIRFHRKDIICAGIDELTGHTTIVLRRFWFDRKKK